MVILMSSTFNPSPELPEEVSDAAQSGMLVIFIGAGISRLVGCPSWNGFATAVLNQLTPSVIDYHEKSLIDSMPDPRKKLSLAKILEEENGITIDYKKIFEVGTPKSDIYSHINRLSCTFVTTNYDKFINPEISATKSEEKWRFYNIEDILRDKLDDQGNVIHLHGCVDNPKSMIVTTKDYLSHYSSEEIHNFLEYMFINKTVLFLGYGLEEIEILEYILKCSNKNKMKEKKLFILQGFFNAEIALFEKLKKYYYQSFNAILIGFPKDYHEYEEQKEIIKCWANKLSFSSIEIVDELKAMEEELNG
jgi:hypothetical protein